MGTRWIGTVLAAGVAGLGAGAVRAQSPPPIPAVVLTHMQELDARCLAAGGREGPGRYVIAQDFTGDGRLDYLVSEGDYDCAGRPGLFRNDGQGRIDIFVNGPGNQARRVYSETLLAYRVLAGRPAKVQVARRGSACGPGVGPQGQCAAQLAWNGQGFGEGVSVVRASPSAKAVVSAPPAAAPVSAPDAGAQGGGQAAFVAGCRRELVSRDASAARWAQEECEGRWRKVLAAGPAAELLLAVTVGPFPALAEVRSRAAGVRWAGRPQGKQLASGALGALDVAVTGAGRPEVVEVGWSQVGADLPYDVAEALRQRGARVEQVACEKLGVGEGQRVFSVAPPGRAPFALTVFQRTAPTGDAWSFYSAAAGLTGQPPARGATGDCDF